MVVDWNALYEKYHTDRSTLTADMAALVDQIDTELADKRARGDIAPESTLAKQAFPIGLDDQLNPYPARSTDPDTH